MATKRSLYPNADLSTVRPVGGVTDAPMPSRVVALVPDSGVGHPPREIEGWCIAWAMNAGLVSWHQMGLPHTAWVLKEKIRKL